MGICVFHYLMWLIRQNGELKANVAKKTDLAETT